MELESGGESDIEESEDEGEISESISNSETSSSTNRSNQSLGVTDDGKNEGKPEENYYAGDLFRVFHANRIEFKIQIVYFNIHDRCKCIDFVEIIYFCREKKSS